LTETKQVVVNAFENLDFWREKRRESGHLLLALDFDGTLAPIVPHPMDAQLVPGARGVIEQLLKRPDTDVALVSGRSLQDLHARCDIPGLFYAGNHGLEIEGPDVHETRPEAITLLPQMRLLMRALTHALSGITGVFVEDKQLSLSIHFRPVQDETEQARIVGIVQQVARDNPDGIKLTYGKRVVEIRPDIDWHKGHATLFLLNSIKRVRGSTVYPIFIGDDLTDEDAFRALADIGAGILVDDSADRHTFATSRVDSINDTIELLKGFVHD
jgi:trehalose 6-phosphate phosphatase